MRWSVTLYKIKYYSTCIFPHFDKCLDFNFNSPWMSQKSLFPIYPFQSVLCAILFWCLNIHSLAFRATVQVSHHLIFHKLVISSSHLLYSTRGRSDYQCTNSSVITPKVAIYTYRKDYWLFRNKRFCYCKNA